MHNILINVENPAVTIDDGMPKVPGREDFNRKCIAHYMQIVLPQLELFECHLSAQRVLVKIERLYPVHESVHQTSLIIFHEDGVRTLRLRYNSESDDLTFALLNGSEKYHQVAFGDFENIKSMHVYDIVEKFVGNAFKLKKVVQ